MKYPYTSLPTEIDQSIKDGSKLFGNDLNDEQLAIWFAQEQEAYYECDAGNSEVDPWYEYMRYVNDMLGFKPLIKSAVAINTMLVLGPGEGKEIENFSELNPECAINFVEASDNFKKILKKKYPRSNIVDPQYSGEIFLEGDSQDLVLAFSVLHHIPNVEKVINEASRVTKVGGYFLVREPCSSMGDWRYSRSATPNERGISRELMIQMAEHAGFALEVKPTPILLEPINKFLQKTIGFKYIPFNMLYWFDFLFSTLITPNDYYWRDNFFKKIGPSSYFFRFKKIR